MCPANEASIDRNRVQAFTQSWAAESDLSPSKMAIKRRIMTTEDVRKSSACGFVNEDRRSRNSHVISVTCENTRQSPRRTTGGAISVPHDLSI